MVMALRESHESNNEYTVQEMHGWLVVRPNLLSSSVSNPFSSYLYDGIYICMYVPW